MTLIEKIRQHSQTRPEHAAAVFKDERLTYAELYHKIASIGSALARDGIKRGDRVLFTATSKPEMVAVYLGIQYAGAIAVFLDKSSNADTMIGIYQDCDASLLLTDKPFKKLSEAVRLKSQRALYQSEPVEPIHEYVPPEPEDIAEIIFTTGTTGKPKGAMLSYRAVKAILQNTIDGVGILESDRLLLALPMNHSFALRDLRAYLWLGATVVLQNGFTFIEEVEENIRRFDCTALALVPATAAKVMNQLGERYTAVLGGLRYIEISSGYLPMALRLSMPERLPGVKIVSTWGSTESGGALFLEISALKDDPRKLSAIGKPLAGVQVRAMDDNGKAFEATEAHPGKLALMGDNLMSGYWNRPELNAKTLVGGWMLTNDLVYVEDDYVYMLGRADDIINVGSEKVSPMEIENAASRVDGIYECACIGVPDPEGILGQVPALFYVTTRQELTEKEINAFLVGHLDRYKLPKVYIRVDEIPRNPLKKIDRKGVRKLWEDRQRSELKNPVVLNILSRRSIRKFTDRKIPREILDIILEAGYSAPSGHNMQTWLFTVLEKRETIQRLREAMRAAAEQRNVHFYGFENPDVVVLISNDKRNHDGCQDASCAAENMFLAANSYDIGSTWVNALMTLRDVEPAKGLLDELGIPENHVVWCTAVFGYPVAPGNKLAKKTNVIRFADR